jgi:hypothetical protein
VDTDVIDAIWAVARKGYAEHAGYGSSDTYSLAQRLVWMVEGRQRLLGLLVHRAEMSVSIAETVYPASETCVRHPES